MEIATPIKAALGFLRVTEAYECIEGEGKTAGAQTFLVRLSGCNLRCWWCDSKYSSFDESEAKQMAWQELMLKAKASGALWLSITGGEPTWRSNTELDALAHLCGAARQTGMKVKIESNGLAMPSQLLDCVDLWSLSPKWDAKKSRPATVDEKAKPGLWSRSKAMDYDEQILQALLDTVLPTALQLKLVICFGTDGKALATEFEEAACLLAALSRSKLAMVPIFLIPQAYESDGSWDKEAYLLRFEALELAARRLKGKPWDGLDLRVQTQRHRLLYGDKRGV